MKFTFKYLALISLATLLFGFTSTHKETPTKSSVASGGNLKDAVITTSFSDANSTDTLSDTFGKDQTYTQLNEMPIAITGGYVLEPGFYEMNCRSYCINAGTHAPSDGDGYLYAPLKGQASEVMLALINNAREHPEIPQTSIQSLLWAILSKAKFMDLPPHLKGVAAILLTPKQIMSLNGGAIGFVQERLLKNMMRSLPFGVRAIMNAEKNIRSVIYNTNTTFEQLERAALLSGQAEITRPDIKRGMWSSHPDGYYLRYFPVGYSRTKVQVYVPKDMTKNEVESHGSLDSSPSSPTTVVFNPEGHVAVPANTGAQRLLITNEDIRFPWNLNKKPPCRWKPLIKTVDTKIIKEYFSDCEAYRKHIAEKDNFLGKAPFSIEYDSKNFKVTKRKGTWTASQDLVVKETFEIEMKIPVFLNICKDECTEVNYFLDDLYTHEEGHIKIHEDIITELKNAHSEITFTSDIGKKEAVEGLYQKTKDIILKYNKKHTDKMNEYDKITNHGNTQVEGPAHNFPGGNNLNLPTCGCPKE